MNHLSSTIEFIQPINCLDSSTIVNDLPMDDTVLFGYGFIIGIAVICSVLSLLSLFGKFFSSYGPRRSSTTFHLLPMGLNEANEYVLGCYDVDSEMYQAVCIVPSSRESEFKNLSASLTAPSNFDFAIPLASYYGDSCNKIIIEVQIDASTMLMSDQFRGAVSKTGSTRCGVGFQLRKLDTANAICSASVAVTTSDELLCTYYSTLR